MRRSQISVEALESRAMLSAVYAQTNLVSDGFVPAAHTDKTLVNAWGISESPSDFWLTSNGTGLSPVYDGTGTTLASPFTVPNAAGHMGNSAPTGVVFNSTSDFAGFFIFSTEDGTISSWGGGASATLKVDHSADNAVYKGLAIGSVGSSNYLYAANFHSGKVEVYDKNFTSVALAGNFNDPGVAAGYAPFGIQNIGGNIYVTYAMQDASKHDDVSGPGHGFVAEFSSNGTFVKEIAAHGSLNSPWGLAVAPSTFGDVGGDLLVGNFGDGKINAYNVTTKSFVGTLNNVQGTPLVIDGLWGLEFGGGGGAGNTNELYFTAGPGGEQHGLFGKLASATPIAISTATLPNWTQNQVGYSQIIATTGGTTPVTFSISAGKLPAGLSLNASTGKITGTPSAAGAVTFTVTAKDGSGLTATHSFTVTINPPLALKTISLPNWTRSLAGYSQSLATTGGTGPLTFTISTGSLPNGLSLNATTGTITGTPTVSNTFAFTVKATDKTGALATHAYSIVINAPIAITTASLPNWTRNQAGYSQTLIVTGGTGKHTFGISAGTLPGGLSLNATTGAITGTPTVGGSFTFTVKATDSVGATSAHAYTVVINAPLAITTGSLINWTQNQAGYSQALGTIGGTGPLAFSVSVGSLPKGLSLNATTGVITGTPTTAGSVTFTIKVTDKTGATTTHAYTVVINAPLAIKTQSLLDSIKNKAGYSQTVVTTGGTGPLTFSVLTGTLPTGLSLNATTGVITGKPTVNGSFTFTIKVTDKSGVSVTHSYTIKITG